MYLQQILLNPGIEDGFSEQAIAQMHISDNAFRTRMSEVYRKFSIGGKEPGKSYKLHDFL
ncbi:hypothetical protein [Mastigocladopsis repens]|uniref:hypothetical protein n=1 Tax=Mastigocladopsis repens TaxID=221287 RepID=UPI0002E90053|nr:hypothetical protein [Mastigocladopsis repens]